MRTYLVKTPRILKAFYSSCIWHIKNNANSVYLTFDDGPHPTITPFVLQELEKYNAKATFFCIGDNVKKYPEVYEQIIAAGHAVGNHTQNHLNGFKVKTDEYITNIQQAAKHIHSQLFRPPYGRITIPEIRAIRKWRKDIKVIMWDVLSGDFDIKLPPQDCLNIVVDNTKPGSIIVFHDSNKAQERLEYTLPKFMEHCAKQEWQFKKLS